MEGMVYLYYVLASRLNVVSHRQAASTKGASAIYGGGGAGCGVLRKPSSGPPPIDESPHNEVSLNN